LSARTASILAFLGLAGCVLWLYWTRSLFGDNPVSIGIQIAAVALMLWARITFGRRSFHAAANPTAGGLVTRGPYRWLRHPIYASILYFVWAGVASHFSAMSAAAGVAATVMVAVRIGSEETLLARQFPEWRDYARRTRRLVPFVF